MQMYAFACKTSSSDVSRTVVSLIYAHCRSLGLEGCADTGFGISFSAVSELGPADFEDNPSFAALSVAVLPPKDDEGGVSGGSAV
jgi:hypothetical protein